MNSKNIMLVFLGLMTYSQLVEVEAVKIQSHHHHHDVESYGLAQIDQIDSSAFAAQMQAFARNSKRLLQK